MKKILFSILMFASFTSFGQGRIVTGFGIEGGVISGGLSAQDAYNTSLGFNGSIYVDLMGRNKKDKPTVGLKLKFTYNPYEMQYAKTVLYPPPNIIINENSISALLKFCLASKTTFYSKKEDDEIKHYKDSKGLFLVVGPQIGFIDIKGGESNYIKNNYSIVGGIEFHINRAYLFIYKQLGFTEIYPSQKEVRLDNVTAGIGIPLF